MAGIITSIILGFLLTGVIGNRLLHLWQHRNWVAQRQFLGAEKEFNDLQTLCDAITTLSGKRRYHMWRLLTAIRSNNNVAIADRLATYDATVVSWNEAVNSFYVRLTLFTTYETTLRLERVVHAPFVRYGEMIEGLVHDHQAQRPISDQSLTVLEGALNRLQGVIWTFNRDLLSAVEAKKEEVYFGKPVQLTSATLNRLSTWQLFVALFKPREYFFSISRPVRNSV